MMFLTPLMGSTPVGHDLPGDVEFGAADAVNRFDLFLEPGGQLVFIAGCRITEHDVDAHLAAVNFDVLDRFGADQVLFHVGIDHLLQGIFNLCLGDVCHLVSPDSLCG